MKEMIKRLYICVLMLGCFPEIAWSEERQATNAAFNPEIYSLSKKKESAFDAPSATYVLSSEDIRRSGSTSIPEALRLVPGVQVSRIDGNKWAIAIRGFDAQFSNKLLVMIDGRTIYTPLFSGVVWDIQDYVMEDIDRIEVVRGPGGTIWGANAVNGVINIITKNAAQTQGGYVSQITGNQDKSITEVRYGGETASNDHYRIYAKNSVREGLDKASTYEPNHDGTKQTRGGFRYDITSIKDSSITLQGDIYSGVADNYFSTLTNVGTNNKDSHGANFNINWEKTLSKKSSFTLHSYYDYDQFNIPILGRSAKTFDVDFQHFYNFSRQNQFTWGAGYRNIQDKMVDNALPNGTVVFNYQPIKRNDSLFTAFIQEKYGLIDDVLFLTIGSKFLHNPFTGLEYQPNAKLSFYPSRNQTIWASVSRAVRTPTRGENGLNLYNGLQKGDSNYGAEKMVAYELGYRIKPTSKILIDATTFYNQYSSLRTFDLDHPGTANPSTTIGNNGSGDSYGFELLGKWQATNDWKLEASYDFLKLHLHRNMYSTDTSLQTSEGSSPKNQVKLKSYYNITPKWQFDNIFYYVDSLPGAKAPSEINGIKAYTRFDTRLGYLPNKNLDLSLGIQNLLDDRHREFNAAIFNQNTIIGRTIFVKMVWQY